MQDLIAVSNPAAAAVFAAPLPAKIVQTLIGEPLTLAALGRVVDAPMNLLHYHVKKFVALGLVEVAHEQARAGRAMKCYRATAKTFFVPAELLTRMPSAEMNRQLREALDRNQARTIEGVNFTHDGRNPRVLLKKASATRASAIELWLDAGLSRADVKELIEDLKAVMERYRSRTSDSAPRYLVHLAAVPVQNC
jgi:predicted ArsR family transcriptional regulator